MTTATFPCLQCGAKLQFAPGQSALKCPYCGSANAIPAASREQVRLAIEERDYERHLADGAAQEPPIPRQTVSCAGCGAQSVLEENVVSDRCTFCAAPLVSSAGRVPRKIVPTAILPFAVQQLQARQAFGKWISGLWFAPNALRKTYRAERGLTGVYTPYWTYDAASSTAYSGERGHRITENERYEENGQSRTRTVQRTEWHPVSGRVEVRFNDILVAGSRTLPAAQADNLGPWRLDALEPYRDEYVSGFRVEAYQIGLADGFAAASTQMEEHIRSAICTDIGGDEQRIDSMDPVYANIRFKHLLLPVWQSNYRYRNRTYRFLVNGQTGKVQGDRPWSGWKIGFTMLAAIAAGGLLYWLATR